MKVLIGCEESQAVCIEFRKRGHEAYSCDLQDCSGGHPEWHIKADIFEVIEREHWDMMIAHPPCTFICNSGVTHLTDNPERFKRLELACEFFKKLWESDIEMICLENPVPHYHAIDLIELNYDQKVQPYNFGIPETKGTCYWLKNLPPLMFTIDAREAMEKLPKKESHRIHYMAPGKDRSKERSKSYPAISEQMAIQWGGLLG